MAQVSIQPVKVGEIPPMIAEIDAALVKILSTALSDVLPKPEQIRVCLPYDPGQAVLGLYLYSVRPCSDMNIPSLMMKGRNVQTQPPRFLTLYYLLTAYSKIDADFVAREDHRILSRAMQAFEETPALTASILGFAPGQYVDTMHLQLLDVPHEEMSAIWSFRETAYRLSAAYRVCPVELPRRSGRMVTRVNDASFSGRQE